MHACTLLFFQQQFLKCLLYMCQILCKVMGVSKTDAVPTLRKLKVCGEDKIITTTNNKWYEGETREVSGCSYQRDLKVRSPRDKTKKSVLKSIKKFQCDKRKEVDKVVMEPWEALKEFCGSYLVCIGEGEGRKRNSGEAAKIHNTDGLGFDNYGTQNGHRNEHASNFQIVSLSNTHAHAHTHTSCAIFPTEQSWEDKVLVFRAQNVIEPVSSQNW